MEPENILADDRKIPPIYLAYYFVLPWTLRKAAAFPRALLTVATANTELSLPHLREARRYGDPGLHGVLTKLSLLMHVVAVMAAVVYMADQDLFYRALHAVAAAFSIGGIEYPDEWQ